MQNCTLLTSTLYIHLTPTTIDSSVSSRSVAKYRQQLYVHPHGTQYSSSYHQLNICPVTSPPLSGKGVAIPWQEHDEKSRSCSYSHSNPPISLRTLKSVSPCLTSLVRGKRLNVSLFPATGRMQRVQHLPRNKFFSLSDVITLL
jgi:hypothetical protein